MIVIALTSNKESTSLFGWHTFIVQSNSMSATDFDAGDLIIVKEVDPNSLKEGDIISFFSTNEANYGSIVTHKIRSLTTDEQGNQGFITYGTTTNSDDASIVTYNNVIGKYELGIPKIGHFIAFLKTTPGYMLFIALPFACMFIFELINFVSLINRYKNEKVLKEKDEQYEDMVNELNELKNKLNMN